MDGKDRKRMTDSAMRRWATLTQMTSKYTESSQINEMYAILGILRECSGSPPAGLLIYLSALLGGRTDVTPAPVQYRRGKLVRI